MYVTRHEIAVSAGAHTYARIGHRPCVALDDRLGERPQIAVVAPHDFDGELTRKYLKQVVPLIAEAFRRVRAVYSMKAACIRLNIGPGLPLPTGRPSSRVTGRMPRVENASQISSALRNCVSVDANALAADAQARGEFADHIARRAGKNVVAVRRRMDALPA